jgi:hypothetical protein
MTFPEFINLNPNLPQERELILNAHLSYLNDLSGQNYPQSNLVQLRSYTEIFLEAITIKTYLYDNEINMYKELCYILISKVKVRNRQKSFIIKLLFSKTSDRFIDQQIADAFEQFLTKTIELISKTKGGHYSNHLSIGDFYSPNNSNKQRIKDLINEAIDLLTNDTTINEKCKIKIIDYLKRAIDEIQSDYTDWTVFLGRLKEAIIILGAIGSFAGGVSVLSAKEKIEEATNVVQNTSISISYKSIYETINIQNAPKLENFHNLLQIEPTKDEIEENKE